MPSKGSREWGVGGAGGAGGGAGQVYLVVFGVVVN